MDLSQTQIIYIILAVVFLPAVWVKLRAFLLKGYVLERHPAGSTIKNETAQFLGLTSLGFKQIRGSGSLVLDENNLHFYRLCPRRAYKIPLSSITGVAVVRRHLGRVRIRRVLKVSYMVDNKPDSIGLYVKNINEWVDKIEAARASFSSEAP